MIRVNEINHVTLIVDDLEKARDFYTNVLNLEELPALAFDYPVMFYKINERQQLHLSEWEDTPSFRGHLCVRVDDFTACFHKFKEMGIIDTSPWGKVRELKDNVMQMFIRDPSGNLIEISDPRGERVGDDVRKDALFDSGDIYVSGRADARGVRGENATLYHGGKPTS